MSALATGLAWLLLVTTTVAPATHWCATVACEPAPAAPCCDPAPAVAAEDADRTGRDHRSDRCRGCLPIDENAATVPDRPRDPPPVAVAAQRMAAPPAIDRRSAPPARARPRGPPHPAVLRDLRCVRLLI